jgi:hypothetical protein
MRRPVERNLQVYGSFMQCGNPVKNLYSTGNGNKNVIIENVKSATPLIPEVNI